MNHEQVVEQAGLAIDALYQRISHHKDAIRAVCVQIDEQRAIQTQARKAIAAEHRRIKAAEYRAKTIEQRRAYSRGYAAALRRMTKNTE
jgi:hypothetical protein